jgi:hypothetical protein
VSLIEKLSKAETNAEAAALAAADASELQYRLHLWSLPIIPTTLVPDLIPIPQSLWETCKATGDSPVMFFIGRRQFTTPAYVRVWIDAKAAQGAPGSTHFQQAQAEALARAQAQAQAEAEREKRIPKRFRSKAANDDGGAK